jgi:hypothetical protein
MSIKTEAREVSLLFPELAHAIYQTLIEDHGWTCPWMKAIADGRAIVVEAKDAVPVALKVYPNGEVYFTASKLPAGDHTLFAAPPDHASLLVEVESLRKDAERWRFQREKGEHAIYDPNDPHGDWCVCVSRREIIYGNTEDEAIDAAIARSKP